MSIKDIFTTMVSKPDGTLGITVVVPNTAVTAEFYNMTFIAQLTEKMADKAVKELWKKHGANIMRKVDKKTIGNLTVKKLTTLIAQELKR